MGLTPELFPLPEPAHSHLRAYQKRQRPCCIWFTGLSGAGKSTLARGLDQYLTEQGYHTYLLDGDNLRTGLNRDLGFSLEDRAENVRRVAEVARLMVDAGLIVVCSLISPMQQERAFARSLFGADRFVEVFVDTPLAACEKRDPKGLYSKARTGSLKGFTGIDSPYEAPENPELRVCTVDLMIEQSLALIMNEIIQRIQILDGL